MDERELKALAVGNNKQAVLKRLIEARSCLKKECRQEFTPYTFDWEHKRLASKDGRYFLQWQLRNHPNEPVSYENQQTSTGDVYLYRSNKS